MNSRREGACGMAGSFAEAVPNRKRRPRPFDHQEAPHRCRVIAGAFRNHALAAKRGASDDCLHQAARKVGLMDWQFDTKSTGGYAGTAGSLGFGASAADSKGIRLQKNSTAKTVSASAKYFHRFGMPP